MYRISETQRASKLSTISRSPVNIYGKSSKFVKHTQIDNLNGMKLIDLIDSTPYRNRLIE